MNMASEGTSTNDHQACQLNGGQEGEQPNEEIGKASGVESQSVAEQAANAAEVKAVTEAPCKENDDDVAEPVANQNQCESKLPADQMKTDSAVQQTPVPVIEDAAGGRIAVTSTIVTKNSNPTNFGDENSAPSSGIPNNDALLIDENVEITAAEVMVPERSPNANEEMQSEMICELQTINQSRTRKNEAVPRSAASEATAASAIVPSKSYENESQNNAQEEFQKNPCQDSQQDSALSALPFLQEQLILPESTTQCEEEQHNLQKPGIDHTLTDNNKDKFDIESANLNGDDFNANDDIEEKEAKEQKQKLSSFVGDDEIKGTELQTADGTTAAANDVTFLQLKIQEMQEIRDKYLTISSQESRVFEQDLTMLSILQEEISACMRSLKRTRDQNLAVKAEQDLAARYADALDKQERCIMEKEVEKHERRLLVKYKALSNKEEAQKILHEVNAKQHCLKLLENLIGRKQLELSKCDGDGSFSSSHRGSLRIKRRKMGNAPSPPGLAGGPAASGHPADCSTVSSMAPPSDAMQKLIENIARIHELRRNMSANQSGFSSTTTTNDMAAPSVVGNVITNNISAPTSFGLSGNNVPVATIGPSQPPPSQYNDAASETAV